MAMARRGNHCSARIDLEQEGQHVWNCIDLRALGDISVTRVVTKDDADHGYDVVAESHSLLYSPDGFCIPNAGCIPLLQARAAALGLELSITCRPPICRLPQPANRERLGYPKLADFVALHKRGLIRVPLEFEESTLIYELALAFPSNTVIVLSSDVAVLERIATQLRSRCQTDAERKSIEWTHARRSLYLGVEEDGPRIICSTYSEVANLDFATSDIVVFADGRQCITVDAQEALEQTAARFRLFGIVRLGERMSPYEEGKMMGVFGPELVDLLGHCWTRRDVHVAWVHHRQPSIHLERKGSDFDYRCVIHNERRNRDIAALARGLAIADPVPIRKHRDIADWCERNCRTQYQVTVLVDRLDHAVALADKLHDWPVVGPDNISLHGYPARVRRMLRPMASWEPARRIVMTDAAEDYPGYLSNIVIWAGAGPCAAPIPDTWLKEPRHYSSPLLIIDFADWFNGTTRKWSKSREREYERRDLFRVGIDPVYGRINRFLKAHQWSER